MAKVGGRLTIVCPTHPSSKQLRNKNGLGERRYVFHFSFNSEISKMK